VNKKCCLSMLDMIFHIISLNLCVGIVSCVSISNYCEIGKKNSKKAKIIVFAINILSKTAGHYGIIALLNCFCDNESQ